MSLFEENLDCYLDQRLTRRSYRAEYLFYKRNGWKEIFELTMTHPEPVHES